MCHSRIFLSSELLFLVSDTPAAPIYKDTSKTKILARLVFGSLPLEYDIPYIRRASGRGMTFPKWAEHNVRDPVFVVQMSWIGKCTRNFHDTVIYIRCPLSIYASQFYAVGPSITVLQV
ncbi:hypothetical protein ES702_02411 [subsurface metagenome]